MIIPMMPLFSGEFTSATLTEYAADTYNAAGELVTGASTNTPIQIIYPQSMKADELQPLSDGERISDFVKTYADETITTRMAAYPANRIFVLGYHYKVHQIEDRPIGQFRKVIMRRING